MMYLNGGCKSKFGENDHHSPSNRAQGHVYGQNACGVILPTSRPQTSKKREKKEVTQNTVPLHFIIVNCKYKDNPEFRFKTNHFH